jgi:UDP-glucose 4-epimerase
VFVSDVARANVLALEAAATDRVFNVATGVETSLTDVANTLLRVMHSGLEPRYGPERKVNPVPRRLANTANAAKGLGFVARVTLDEGLQRFVEWWKSERNQTRNDDRTDTDDAAGHPARPAVA